MTTVVTCPVGRRAALVEILTAAFATDPVVGWLLGAGRDRERRRRAFFRLVLPPAVLDLGGCDLAGDDGAAVWFPPGTFAVKTESSLRDLPAALAAFGLGLRRAGAADAAMRRNHPTRPHWYLQFVGVRPDRVGRGIGTALLEHRLATIDATHAAAYLESSHERNLPLYERFGFVVTDEVRLGPGAPPEWLMWRAPVG